MAFNSELIPYLIPSPMEIIMMTEEIPMIMPSMVNTERPLLLLIFIRAILIYSHICVITNAPFAHFRPNVYCNSKFIPISGITVATMPSSISEYALFTITSVSLIPSFTSVNSSVEIPHTIDFFTITPFSTT